MKNLPTVFVSGVVLAAALASALPAQVGGRTWRTMLEFDEADNLRLQVASAGDLDGEGLGDVVLFEWDHVAVRSGRNASILLWIDLPGGIAYSDVTVLGTGDVDGDGVPDLAVGLPLENTAAGAGSGAIHLYSGRDGHEIRVLTVDLYAVHLGIAMADPGDLDGDGVHELAAGVPLWWRSPPGGTGSGRVVVWSGRTGHVVWNLDPPDGVQGVGGLVAGAGDVDGDGVPDLAATGSDAVCLYSGATGRVLDVLRFEPDQDVMALAGGADWTGDGLAELCMGLPWTDEPPGPDSGGVVVWSHALGREVLQIPGPTAGARAGSALSVGDVDGEPGPELLVGAPGWGPLPGLEYGAVLVYDIPGGELLRLEAGRQAHDALGTQLQAMDDPDATVFGRILVVSGEPTYAWRDPHASLLALVPFLAPRYASVSRAAGGRLVFELDFGGEQAFHAYRILASAHGTGPGFFQGLEVPLTSDALFAASARGGLPTWAWNFDGVLDQAGRATAVAVPPPGGLPAALVGKALYLAAVAGPLSGRPETASLPAVVAVEP